MKSRRSSTSVTTRDFPVDRRWQGMTRQLTTLIDSLAEPKLWLVGHSMGGYLSLLAAGQRPRRVRGIILLDAPIIHGWKSGLIGVVKAAGQMPRVSPAAGALKRRDRWPDLGEVHGISPPSRCSRAGIRTCSTTTCAMAPSPIRPMPPAPRGGSVSSGHRGRDLFHRAASA